MNEEGKLLLKLINALCEAPAEQKTVDFEMPYPVALWFVQHKDDKNGNGPINPPWCFWLFAMLTWPLRWLWKVLGGP